MTTLNKKIKWAAVRFVSPSPHNLKPLHPVPSFRNANAPAPIPTLDTVPYPRGSRRVLEVDIYTADNGIMLNYCLSDDEARYVLVEREIKYYHQGGKRLYRLCFDDCINALANQLADAHPRTRRDAVAQHRHDVAPHLNAVLRLYHCGVHYDAETGEFRDYYNATVSRGVYIVDAPIDYSMLEAWYDTL